MKGIAVQLTVAPEAGAARDDPWGGCLSQVAGGDADALARLYDGTSSLVYGLALRILRDAGGAEEITEDVYMQAWRQAARFDPARGSVIRWLLTVTRSRAIDRLRVGASTRDRHAPIEDAGAVRDPAPEPEHAAEAGQRRALVRAALAALSAEQRQAVELAYFAGLSHTEIAAQLGAPLGTVKTRIRLGMNHLRTVLGAVGREA